MRDDVRNIMMATLWLTLVGLLLVNYTAFSSIMDATFGNWIKLLRVLQTPARRAR